MGKLIYSMEGTLGSVMVAVPPLTLRALHRWMLATWLRCVEEPFRLSSIFAYASLWLGTGTARALDAALKIWNTSRVWTVKYFYPSPTTLIHFMIRIIPEGSINCAIKLMHSISRIFPGREKERYSMRLASQ